MFDVAILGSGFAGSLMSMILRRLGRSVLLLERHQHPRFVIGESSTPLADLLWLDLCRKYDLAFLEPFAKWGTWRRAHPGIACGLKRGFSFYHHDAGRPFAARPDRSDQLLVAASPRDELADTHWYRPDFDAHLVAEARRLGVDYRDQCEVTHLHRIPRGFRIECRRNGTADPAEAAFVIDAGSRAGALARSLGLTVEALPVMPATQALYTHFEGVERLDHLPLHDGIETAPFPVDDAAVHHVFEDGWIWVLRFCNGITSAGVAVTEPGAQRLRLHEGEAAWQRLLASLPTVARQFARARPTRPFEHAPRLGFRVTPAAGSGWALLPSAAGFVDPMLSSGFTLNLLGIERLAAAFAAAPHDGPPAPSALEDHSQATAGEAAILEHFVAALYARFPQFDAFTDLARLYFGVVIHSETTRRLGRSSAHGYLLRTHPTLAEPIRDCLNLALQGVPAAPLRASVDHLLQHIDLGGLLEPDRRPWYPVVADDLRRHRDRIPASAAEVEHLLRTSGLTP